MACFTFKLSYTYFTLSWAFIFDWLLCYPQRLNQNAKQHRFLFQKMKETEWRRQRQSQTDQHTHNINCGPQSWFWYFIRTSNEMHRLKLRLFKAHANWQAWPRKCCQEWSENDLKWTRLHHSGFDVSWSLIDVILVSKSVDTWAMAPGKRMTWEKYTSIHWPATFQLEKVCLL